MKLPPDEIRKRVRGVVHEIWDKCQTREQSIKSVIGLIEEATGEKLPEPFDEGKVRHGSVWASNSSKVVLVETDDLDQALTAIAIYGGRAYPSGINWSTWGPGLDVIIRHLKECKFRYLGQYNFSAGLPTSNQ